MSRKRSSKNSVNSWKEPKAENQNQNFHRFKNEEIHHDHVRFCEEMKDFEESLTNSDVDESHSRKEGNYFFFTFFLYFYLFYFFLVIFNNIHKFRL